MKSGTIGEKEGNESGDVDMKAPEPKRKRKGLDMFGLSEPLVRELIEGNLVTLISLIYSYMRV